MLVFFTITYTCYAIQNHCFEIHKHAKKNDTQQNKEERKCGPISFKNLIWKEQELKNSTPCSNLDQ